MNDEYKAIFFTWLFCVEAIGGFLGLILGGISSSNPLIFFPVAIIGIPTWLCALVFTGINIVK